MGYPQGLSPHTCTLKLLNNTDARYPCTGAWPPGAGPSYGCYNDTAFWLSNCDGWFLCNGKEIKATCYHHPARNIYSCGPSPAPTPAPKPAPTPAPPPPAPTPAPKPAP